MDHLDNCWLLTNPVQSDQDGDLLGDSCDGDQDGDGLPNQLDNCPADPNPDQLDRDDDGTGDACDPETCCFNDDLGGCIDPTTPFTVYLPDTTSVTTGETFYPVFWANRKLVTIQYRWSVSGPEGSRSVVVNPEGSTSYEFQYGYHYPREEFLVSLVPDMPGWYEIRLDAALSFEDELFPQHSESNASFLLLAK
jgi:hypothetical protein